MKTMVLAVILSGAMMVACGGSPVESVSYEQSATPNPPAPTPPPSPVPHQDAGTPDADANDAGATPPLPAECYSSPDAVATCQVNAARQNWGLNPQWAISEACVNDNGRAYKYDALGNVEYDPSTATPMTCKMLVINTVPTYCCF